MQLKYNHGDKILIPEISTSPLTIMSIHEGGFGRVYEVITYSGDKVALKILKWELGLNRADLVSEAEKLADLANHPNITEVLGLYKLDGNPCIAMRYYPQTLAVEMINRLTPPRILEILNQIAFGLAYLHDEVGMLHLDLKPQNILIDENGVASISDFGISVAFPKPTQNSITKDLFMSGITGTITYMSPEQFTTHKVSPKTDIFSLGTLLYEILTGRHPFICDSYEQTVNNILTIKPTFNTREKILIPSLLRNICLACLEKNPTLRPKATDIFKITLKENSCKSLSTSTYKVDSARLINKASTLAAIGRLNEAQLILEECLESEPYNLSAAINLAEVYYLSGNINKSVEFAEIAFSIFKWFPNNQDSLVTLFTNISSYYLSINPKKSIDYARNATQLDSYDWQALGNIAEGCRVLGESHGDQNLLNDGLESCHKAMALNPDNLKLKVTYGGILLALKDYKILSPCIVDLLNTYGGDDIHLRFLLIRTLIAVDQLTEAEDWLAPMRKHKELTSMVAIADKELLRKINP